LLYGFISRYALAGRVLDVGAGSGIVGLLVGRDFPSASLEAVEKQPLYVEFARRNAAINGIGYTLHEGDFLELGAHGSYDWIVQTVLP
jgi:tRNA1(Val) A37 N6-methylase TrmN6